MKPLENVRKALGRWPKYCAGQPEGCKRRREGRQGGFKARLVPNVAFRGHEKTSLKAPGRWPKYCAGQPDGSKRRRQGRRGGLKARLVPNVAFGSN